MKNNNKKYKIHKNIKIKTRFQKICLKDIVYTILKTFIFSHLNF